ncbi:Brp/Blh family beta-carotene 15,15'-dioxygenase, partial [Acinetobacter baumannii]
LLSLLLIRFEYATIVWGILATIFLTFGLSHGAIDHLTEKKITTSKALLQFVGTYIGKGLLFALFWWMAPTLALIGFI